MYIVFEVVGGIVKRGLKGFKGDYKDFQTGPEDKYGKRVNHRVHGAVFLILIFNILIYLINKL